MGVICVKALIEHEDYSQRERRLYPHWQTTNNPHQTSHFRQPCPPQGTQSQSRPSDFIIARPTDGSGPPAMWTVLRREPITRPSTRVEENVANLLMSHRTMEIERLERLRREEDERELARARHQNAQRERYYQNDDVSNDYWANYDTDDDNNDHIDCDDTDDLIPVARQRPGFLRTRPSPRSDIAPIDNGPPRPTGRQYGDKDSYSLPTYDEAVSNATNQALPTIPSPRDGVNRSSNNLQSPGSNTRSRDFSFPNHVTDTSGIHVRMSDAPPPYTEG